MKYIESPIQYSLLQLGNKYTPSVFLGGSITGAADWQAKLLNDLNDFQEIDAVIFNPRRANFDITDPNMSSEQITWEHKYLRQVDILVFYFSSETLAPITLFELGAALERRLNSNETVQDIIIYCDPEYKRKFDVEFQTNLAIELYSKQYKLDMEFRIPVICETYKDLVYTIHNKIKEVDALMTIVSYDDIEPT